MQILRLLKQQKDGCCHCRCLAIVFLPQYLCQKPQKKHPERPYGSNPASGQHDIEKEQTAGQNRSRYDSKQKPPHQPVYPHPDHCSMKPRYTCDVRDPALLIQCFYIRIHSSLFSKRNSHHAPGFLFRKYARE